MTFLILRIRYFLFWKTHGKKSKAKLLNLIWGFTFPPTWIRISFLPNSSILDHFTFHWKRRHDVSLLISFNQNQRCGFQQIFNIHSAKFSSLDLTFPEFTSISRQAFWFKFLILRSFHWNLIWFVARVQELVSRRVVCQPKSK